MLSNLTFIYVLFGCQDENPLGFATTQSTAQCLNPVDDTWTALTEDAARRGLNLEMPGWKEHHECNVIPGGVVAQDLNRDGWEDLVFLNHEGSPWIFRNQEGEFKQVEVDLPLFGNERPALSLGAIDINGDRLPDLIQTGMGYLAVSENLGDFQFSDWELVVNEGGFPYSCFGSFSIGDLDRDGDLDIVLAGTDQAVESGVWPGTEYPNMWGAYTLLLENTSVGWQTVRELSPWDGVPELSVLQVITDFDNDQDLDILSSSDRSDGIHYPPLALWENDGTDNVATSLYDIAPELGIDLPISGMGLGSNDINGDGWLDYCISDVANHLICLLSDGFGGFYEAGQSLGLEVDPARLPNADTRWVDPDPDTWLSWSAWSLVLQDLDNDGRLDFAATGGTPPDYGSVDHSDVLSWQPDWLWMGTESGFVDADLDHPFFNPRGMYGMVSVDLDRDGYRELIKAPAEGIPEIWNNPCAEYNWLEIDLLGVDQNVEAYGSKVFVHHGDTVDIQEVHGLLTMGQSPSSIHVGLGDASSVSKIEIWWSDGAVSTHRDVVANQHVLFKHPSLVTR